MMLFNIFSIFPLPPAWLAATEKEAHDGEGYS
jgi:hypothetical protein